MQDNNITNFLDLPDIIATDLIQTKDYYIFIAEAKEESVKCPKCGSITNKLHDQRWQNIQDISIRNKLTIIRLNKKRYRCNCCGKRGISENYESLDAYSRKTKRFEEYLANESQSKNYTKLAKENELSYTAIDNAIKKYLDPIIEEKTSNLENIEAISIDEFSIKKKEKYAVVISDPLNHNLIDICPSRKKDDLIEYFKSWSEEQRKQIKYFSMDMWKPYKSVAQKIFPNAEIIVDKFHLVALVNKHLDEIRKTIQNKVGKFTRKKFFKSRMLLKKAGEKLTDKDHQKLMELFKLSPELEKAWELKEEFRDLLQIADINEATAALDQWYQRVSDSKLSSFNKVKKTIKRWEPEIFNYFKTKITNGFAEGINNKIKLIKRIGYGVPNIINLRRRVFNAVI